MAGGTATGHFALARYWGDNSPPSYALGSANAVFVAMVYRQLLGREVDAAGLPGWVNWLSRGASRAQVVQAIEQSAEYRTKVVDNLYLQFLHRTADSAGEAGFVAALGAGMTIEQVKAIFLGSPELSTWPRQEERTHFCCKPSTTTSSAERWTQAAQPPGKPRPPPA